MKGAFVKIEQDMELNQLKSFVQIVETGNLRKAADALFISQSALSHQIKVLEERLALQLFIRTSKGMELTEQGRILYSHAMAILSQVDTFQEKARQLSGRTTRAFKIGINTHGKFLQVSRLSRVLKNHFPRSEFFFVSSQTIHTTAMLRDKLIDIGFFFGDNQAPDISTHLISQCRLRIVIPNQLLKPGTASPDWPLLAQLPWIWSVYDCPFYGTVLRRMAEEQLTPNHAIDAMDESVIKELIIDGQGVGILREDDARDVSSQADVTIWEQESFLVPLQIGMLKSNRSQAMFRKTAELIEQLWR